MNSEADGEQPMNGIMAPDPIPFWRRMIFKIFPWKHLNIDPPEWAKDGIVNNVTVELGFVDRIRVFLTGRFVVRVSTSTENKVGRTEATSIFIAAPPRWAEYCLPFLLCLLLPSCVEFQANGGATAAHYKGPPWGKVAYAKGDEMFTTDHDAGFIALVTAVQNLLSQLGLAVIAGDVVKVQQLTQQLLNKGVSQQVIAQTTANASAAASAAKLAATKAGIAGGAPLAPIKITAP